MAQARPSWIEHIPRRYRRACFSCQRPMAPMKKAMKAAVRSLNKTAIADAVAVQSGLTRKQCSSVITSLADVVHKEVKKTGKIIIPGIVRVVTRRKPATKAGKREIFGVVKMVKAKPAKTVIKAFAVAALKNAV